jgi:hypothetical protein
MMMRASAASLVGLLAPLLLLSAGSRAAAEQHFFCPKTVFYKPKRPHIHYKHICPQAVCPCRPLPNFGYYPTIWHPWPFPICSQGIVPSMNKTEPSSGSAAPTNTEPLSQPSKMPQEPTLP